MYVYLESYRQPADSAARLGSEKKHCVADNLVRADT